MQEQSALAPAPIVAFQSSLFFESHEEIVARVFRELKPRTPVPAVRIEFRRWANANSAASLKDGVLHVRLADLFEGAPSPIVEALAQILIGKMYRREVPRIFEHRYRLYLNRRDVRRHLQMLRSVRGRKFVSGPKGSLHNLEEIFEELNRVHFDGLMGRPQLGWSRIASRSALGHFDPSHNAIIISRIFDRPAVPRLALEYVMFHEMLHLRYPVEHGRVRRCVHTRDFRTAEKGFPRLKEAKELLKKL